jgi:hypothetical protein
MIKANLVECDPVKKNKLGRMRRSYGSDPVRKANLVSRKMKVEK